MMHLLTSVRRTLSIASCLLALGATASAAEPAVKTFDLPAGPAAETLKQFAVQSGREIVFAPQAVAKVTTSAVKGEFTPAAALDVMLAGTGLIATQDQKTGAFAVRRDERPKGVVRSLALAQAAVSPESDRVLELAPYEVTGVRETGVVNQGIIPREANEAVRYNVFTREAIDRSGASSLSELLLRQVTQAANYGTGTQRTYSGQLSLFDGIAVPADRIDLRGLGSNQTLVMVNGRRLYGNEIEGPDISRIPLSAVERIEISPSSGSAIYGANAMAGVVNIVLRKNFSGGETSLYYGGARGGADETRLSVFHGFNLNGGRTNVTINAEYKNIQPLSLGDRGYHLRALDRFPPNSPNYVSEVLNNFFGPRPTVVRSPATTGLGIPANPTANVAIVPRGSTGTDLTPASFNESASTGVVDPSRLDRTNLVGPLESFSIFSTIEHAIRGERLAAYIEASYRWADNGAGAFSEMLPTLALGATHPLNPFRTGVTPGFVGSSVDVKVVPADLPTASQTSRQRTMRFVAGLKGQFTFLGDREVKWSADASWDRDETEANTLSYTKQLRIATANGLYNPLRDLTNAPLLPTSELDKLRSNVQNLRHPEITATNWRANGELFDLWGGPATFSLGAEFRYEYQFMATRYSYGAYADLPPAQGVFPSKNPSYVIQTNRRSYAGYLETIFPLVGERNRRPLVHALSVSTAVRYEKYDDFGAATPPMVALKWALLPDVALRAQFSEGFQPPTQSQLTSPGSLIGPVPFFASQYTDSKRPGLANTSALILRSGAGNPGLRPETSDTWDGGIIVTPRFLPGLTLNVAYFRYDKRDLAAQLSLQENVDAGRILRGERLATDPAGVPGPIIQIDSPVVNVSRQFTDGFDYSIDYSFRTRLGHVALDAAATQTRRFNRQATPTAAPVDSLGDIGFGSSVPIKWRGRGGLAWKGQRWGAGWTARYIDSYIVFSNNPTPSVPFRKGLDGPNIPSSIEHDVQLHYDVPLRSTAGLKGWLSGTRWTLGAMNVFDRDPPYQTNSGALWYSAFNDPRQRFIYIEVRKSH